MTWTHFLIWTMGFPVVMELIRIGIILTRKHLGQKPFDDEAQGCGQLIEWLIWIIVACNMWDKLP